MRFCLKILQFPITLAILLFISIAHAHTPCAKACPMEEQGPVEERAAKENNIPPNSFAITFYKPTYILPYYYTFSPYKDIYYNNTPDNEGIKRYEMKFQISFKVPIWKNIFCRPTTLFLAYTQLSYWQAYNRAPFFRETDYEPEIFLANEINFQLHKAWHINFLNLGAVHQSNGYGSRLERSWNRIYLEAISSTGNWMVSVKSWVVLNDNACWQHNKNIADFLGYGQVLVAYKYYNQVISLQARNFLDNRLRRATAEFNWTFPITPYINGCLQLFSGYGQSLIEYNHHTNSAGIGISLSNWI